MPEQPATLHDADRKTRKISIQERAIPVGDFIVVNGYRTNRDALKQRFSVGGYQVHETTHFLLFIRAEEPRTILVHWFAPEEMNADVKHYLTQELKPFRVITHMHQFGELLAGIVGSLFPDDVQRSWRYFGSNTLQRFLSFLSTAYTPPLPDYATIGMFATLYQRVCELRVGETFLDAGCASGFLPLLVAERIPFLKKIVGVDIQAEAFTVAEEIARERELTTIQFAQADLLTHDLDDIGQFDTVVALHVLEHLSEADMFRALSNLMRATSQRLIVAVPYEQGEPEVAYGHLQSFSRNKLRSVGEWCIQELKGKGRLWLEDCVGGLLLVDLGNNGG